VLESVEEKYYKKIVFSSKFTNEDTLFRIFFPTLMCLLSIMISVILLNRPTIGVIIGVSFLGPYEVVLWLYRLSYWPAKIGYTSEGIYYVLRNGREGFIPWKNVHSIRQIRRHSDYILYYKREARWYEISKDGVKIDTLFLGEHPGEDIWRYWLQIMKEDESKALSQYSLRGEGDD